MIDLEKLIRENKEVTGYRIITVKKDSFQLYFVHRSLETIRNNDTKSVYVRIYVAHDEYVGESEFRVYPAYLEDEIRGKISQAVVKAKLINNEAFELPKKEEASYLSDSNFENYSLEELAKMTEEAVYKADSYKDGSINALEIFITKIEKNVVNSNGLNKSQVTYDAMIEAIPTWNGKRESVELYEQYHFNEFDSEKITAEIDDKMKAVRARYDAIKPESITNVNVLLRPNEIVSIIESIAEDINFGTVYQHGNKNEIGTNLQDGAKGDLLTLSLVGKVKGAVESSNFDDDGTTLKDTVIVEDGVVKSYFGGMKHAQYLKVEPTGNLAIAKLNPGTKSLDELKKEPYLECVSMSGIQVDLFNDYIGGEIRLGYYFDGTKVTPVTGISISGSLTEVLKEMYLSKEVGQEGPYYGPKIAAFKGFNVQ